jgi:hypothetical protein
MKNKGDVAWEGAQKIILKNRELCEKFLEDAQLFHSEILMEDDKEAVFNKLVEKVVIVILMWSMLCIMNKTLGDAQRTGTRECIEES